MTRTVEAHVDPISLAALAAMAGGMGGEAGRQAWTGLVALVRRPFRREDEDDDSTSPVPALTSGDDEVAALAQNPDDPARAQALLNVLSARAAVDPEFRRALDEWSAQARTLTSGAGDVHNSISDSTVHGSVVQVRDITNLTIGVPPQH